MNDSGSPLAAFLRFHRIELPELVVLHDDIAFEPGQLRLSLGGSAAGHNGVASCIRHLGEPFVRARLGIGSKQHPGQDLADHVLGRFPDADLAALTQRIPDFIKHLEILLSQGLPAAQNLTNRKSPSP
jgi:PTH1 family peptidyl-tRNA hydrolase